MFHRSRRWAGAMAALWLGLTVFLTPPARADDNDRHLPPPGTQRLIRIGPQALVSEDEHGRLIMVDEPPPETSNRQLLGFLVGLLAGGLAVVLLPGLSDIDGRILYRGGAGSPRSPESP